eukprot:1347823-Rhodomonas_salina.1
MQRKRRRCRRNLSVSRRQCRKQYVPACSLRAFTHRQSSAIRYPACRSCRRARDVCASEETASQRDR